MSWKLKQNKLRKEEQIIKLNDAICKTAGYFHFSFVFLLPNPEMILKIVTLNQSFQLNPQHSEKQAHLLTLENKSTSIFVVILLLVLHDF